MEAGRAGQVAAAVDEEEDDEEGEDEIEMEELESATTLAMAAPVGAAGLKAVWARAVAMMEAPGGL